MRLKSDLLGIFPVYYCEPAENVFLAASSPKLILAHPLVKPEIDSKGLIGILLLNAIFKNRTLFKGIVRVDYGSRLEKYPDEPACEIKIFSIPAGIPAYADEFFEKHLSRADEALEETLKKQVLDDDCGLSLSGGLDSRTLAGYLKKLNKKTLCFTFGQPNDTEMKCAQAVGRALGFQHETKEISHEKFWEYAVKESEWTCLSGGLSTLWAWDMVDFINKTPRRVVLGYLLDCIFGSLVLTKSIHDVEGLNFEQSFNFYNSWGVNFETLKNLFPEDSLRGDSEFVYKEIRDWYHQLGQSEFRRTWLFEILTRQRFYIGNFIWKCSFGAWPIVPVLSKKLLVLISNIPAGSLAHRHLQKELLKRYFLKLADIPLDVNHPEPYYLDPKLSQRIKKAFKSTVFDILPPRIRNFYRMRNSQFYKPLYDVRSLGWRKVIDDFEKNRICKPNFFSQSEWNKTLSKLKQGGHKDSFGGPSGDKMLLGFAILIKNSFISMPLLQGNYLDA